VPNSSYGGISSAPLFSLDSQAAKLIRPAASPGRENAKIEKSAKDFESLLLGGWLQQAEQSFAKLPGGDDEEDADAGSGELQGIAMQSLGTAMTEAGGIGLAKMISRQLHKVEDNAAVPAAERNSVNLGVTSRSSP
jgi:Rod binding domain-containing protein